MNSINQKTNWKFHLKKYIKFWWNPIGWLAQKISEYGIWNTEYGMWNMEYEIFQYGIWKINFYRALTGAPRAWNSDALSEDSYGCMTFDNLRDVYCLWILDGRWKATCRSLWDIYKYSRYLLYVSGSRAFISFIE